mmetsp:Transcript_17981/g.46112  ORF Transcript_17981/g.46112 Transcript_17981/m.46112 type:complete len:479 (+) Transcript_17981:164-1600(+)
MSLTVTSGPIAALPRAARPAPATSVLCCARGVGNIRSQLPPLARAPLPPRHFSRPKAIPIALTRTILRSFSPSSGRTVRGPSSTVVAAFSPAGDEARSSESPSPVHVSSSGATAKPNNEVEDVTPPTLAVAFTDAEREAERAAQPWWRRLARAGGHAAAIACLALALLVTSPLGAEAARSGGRVGGRAFSSRSYTPPSYSSRSSSALGGGGGSMLGSGRSYGGMQRAPSTVVVGPSYGMSSFFFPTYGYGMGGGGSSLFNLLFLGFAGYVIVTAVSSMLADNAEGGAGGAAGGACSVVKLQVGLLGSARELQRDLDALAGRADTSTPGGLSFVLQETVLALLRNPDYCVYGFSSNSKAPGLDGAEAAFNEQTLAERSKFRSETLVNVGGRSGRASAPGAPSSDLSNELIVVTVVAAVEGRLQLPRVESLADLKAALGKLGAVPAEGLLAVEVLWTPQEEGDTFTRDEIVTDYPSLNQL